MRTSAKKKMLSAAALAALVSSGTLGCGGQTAQTTGDTTTEVAEQAPSVTVTSTASRGYVDGTYTGDSVRTHYGDVQVQVVVEGGLVTDIALLAYPTGRESDHINEQAAPILEQEAIESQSAVVDAVSGATLTSEAFMESLSSALDQAS